MSAVGSVLTRAGLRVSEERFAALVEAALAEIGGPGAGDPGATLAAGDVAALTAVGADLAPRRSREADPRAATAAAYAGLLADSRSVAEVAGDLGIDTSRVRHRLADRGLIGIRRSGGWLLPAYQFDAAGRPLPGLER